MMEKKMIQTRDKSHFTIGGLGNIMTIEKYGTG